MAFDMFFVYLKKSKKFKILLIKLYLIQLKITMFSREFF